jgi:hypothetical protein
MLSLTFEGHSPLQVALQPTIVMILKNQSQRINDILSAKRRAEKPFNAPLYAVSAMKRWRQPTERDLSRPKARKNGVFGLIWVDQTIWAYPGYRVIHRVVRVRGVRGVHGVRHRESGDRRDVPLFSLTMRCRTFFISAGGCALAGIAARVPVGLGPELSRRRSEPPRSCRACGTYLHGRNAPGNNSPIRLVPTAR